jgi:hypothetical protein
MWKKAFFIYSVTSILPKMPIWVYFWRPCKEIFCYSTAIWYFNCNVGILYINSEVILPILLNFPKFGLLYEEKSDDTCWRSHVTALLCTHMGRHFCSKRLITTLVDGHELALSTFYELGMKIFNPAFKRTYIFSTDMSQHFFLRINFVDRWYIDT